MLQLKNKMKTIVILSVLLVAFVILAKAAFPPVEQQQYVCLEKEGKFEIRRYPPALVASVYDKDKSYSESANSSFRRLANFIFGGNQNNVKIAMTAPVHMEFSESGSKMSFVMPSGFDEKSLPRPNDPGVEITRSEERKVVVLGFGGFANDKKIKSKTAELMRYIEERGLKIKGSPEYLGYDSPFKLVGRKNEIIAEIL